MRKGFALPLIILIGVISLAAASLFFFIKSKPVKVLKPENIKTVVSPTPIPSQTITPATPQPITKLGYSKDSGKRGLKTYISTNSGYSFEYPQNWVVQAYNEKYPTIDIGTNNRYVVFQTRETIGDEMADGPGLPRDIATGSITISAVTSTKGFKFPNISEQDFLDPKNDFWFKGNTGGGGGGSTYLNPEVVHINGKNAMKQVSHPTIAWEWVGPEHICTNYYFWIGNVAKEVATISFCFGNNNKDYNEKVKEFDQMVSTFKFTN